MDIKAESMLKNAADLIKESGVLSIIDASDNKLKKTNRWVNTFTKWSMFDLNTNIERLIDRTELNLQLVEKNVLSEVKLFNSFIYKRI